MVLAGPKDENGKQLEPKRAIIRPPALLVLAGLARPDEFYEVMAFYGYKESPKPLVRLQRQGVGRHGLSLRRWNLDPSADGH